MKTADEFLYNNRILFFSFFAEWALQRVGDCGYARTVPGGTKKIPKVRFKVFVFTYTEQELPIYLRLMHSSKQASR